MTGGIEDPEVLVKLVFKTVEQYSKLDILMNNAGWMELALFESTSIKDVRTMLEVRYELEKPSRV